MKKLLLWLLLWLGWIGAAGVVLAAPAPGYYDRAQGKAGRELREAGYWMLDAGYWMLDGGAAPVE